MRRAVLPERDVLRLRRTEAVKVYDDVCAAVCGEADDLVTRIAERLAPVVRRIDARAEPVGLVDRQAYAVRLPLVDGYDRRLRLLRAVRNRLHAAGVDALEPHFVAVGVHEPIALDLYHLRPLRAILWFVGHETRLDLALALSRGAVERFGGGCDTADVLHLHLARIDLEEARHDDESHGLGRHEERRLAILPALRIALRVYRARVLDLLAGSVLELEEDARVEPGFGACLEVFDLPLPGELQRLDARRHVILLVGVDELAWLL